MGTWGRLINDDASKGFLSIGSNVVLPFNVHRRGKMSGGLLMMTLVVLGGAIFMVVRLIGKVSLPFPLRAPPWCALLYSRVLSRRADLWQRHEGAAIAGRRQGHETHEGGDDQGQQGLMKCAPVRAVASCG